MELLTYVNDLKYYSLRDLTYGLFIWLNNDVTPRTSPISYELFKYYLIYNKRFNEYNTSRILELYQKYSALCKDHIFMNNPDWIKKSNFKIIENITTSCCSKLYFIDRGYSEEESEKYVKLMANHTYVFKYENVWDNFIRSFDKILPPVHFTYDIITTKINKATGQFFTEDDINKILLKRIKPNPNKNTLLLFPILTLFYNDNYTYKDEKDPYDIFKHKIVTYWNVIDDDVFIQKLYNYYINTDFKLRLINSLKLYHLVFKDILEKTSPNIISMSYWTCRGYSEEVAAIKIGDILKERAVSYDRIYNTYDKDVADEYMKQYKEKRNNTINEKRLENPEFGKMFTKTINPDTGEYYTGDALHKKRQEFNIPNALKGTMVNAANIRAGKTKTVWQKEYWIEKGFTEQEAKQKVYDIMPHNGIEYYILKYGEKVGTEKYNKRIEKYKNTMNNKSPEEMMEIIKKRTVKSYKVSNTSIKFFNELLHRLSLENITFDKVYMNTNEYYIYDIDRKTVYFYDFCIPEYKIIIEFNGIKYHPHPNLSDKELAEWRSLFYEVEGIYQRDRDDRKEYIAIQHDFAYLVIWDIDEIETSLKKSIQFIKQNILIHNGLKSNN